ncbi:MAG TPA: hypothetical protein VMH80_03340 [Bryobacteraceae bacterium]|nr:hypothetical protein [Bryobacteraceae bacterium]
MKLHSLLPLSLRAWLTDALQLSEEGVFRCLIQKSAFENEHLYWGAEELARNRQPTWTTADDD